MTCCNAPGCKDIMGGFCRNLTPHVTNKDLSDSYSTLSYFSDSRFYQLLYGWWPRFKRIFFSKPLPRTSTNNIDHWLSAGDIS